MFKEPIIGNGFRQGWDSIPGLSKRFTNSDSVQRQVVVESYQIYQQGRICDQLFEVEGGYCGSCICLCVTASPLKWKNKYDIEDTLFHFLGIEEGFGSFPSYGTVDPFQYLMTTFSLAS